MRTRLRLGPSFLVVAALAASSICALPTRAADPPPGGTPPGAPPPTDPTARAEWLSNQAATAFSDKRYADAIRLYLDAWEAAPAASILYNVAFIYDKRLSDPELAIDYYQRAADSPDADADLATKSKARVAALRAEQNKPPDKPPDKPPEHPHPDQSNFGPWVITASGGALLLGGVVMAFVASGTQSDFEDADSAAEKRSLQSQGRTEALVADLLMGTGVAAIGVGVVWMIVDSGAAPEQSVTPNPADETGLRIEPRLIPGGAALILGGSL